MFVTFVLFLFESTDKNQDPASLLLARLIRSRFCFPFSCGQAQATDETCKIPKKV